MAKDSRISWTHHTFNPWIGCNPVSAGCDNCYAKRQNQRYKLDHHWGPPATTTRHMMASTYWKQPASWNRRAQDAGERHRVFVGSFCDVFEDHPQVIEPRRRLFNDIIPATHNLDWFLLTKRFARRENHMPDTWLDGFDWPENIWIGLTIENRAALLAGLGPSRRPPAGRVFVSCEPLLEVLGDTAAKDIVYYTNWVIVGGETGPNARPMPLAAVRQLRDACIVFGVPFHFKQWGEWVPASQIAYDIAKVHPRASQREFFGEPYYRLGRHHTGRLLYGQLWDQFPVTAAAHSCAAKGNTP